MAAAGDAGVRLDRPRGDVHDAAHPLRNFPFLGFAGNRPGRLRGGKERGKNHAGPHAKTPFILDPINFLICDFRSSDSFHFKF